jgi:aspartoacylase
MQAPRVLVVAATHGNERNGGWLMESWRQEPSSLNNSGLELLLEIGNPAAYRANRRYIDRDLNRSFVPDLLADAACDELEIQRARELLAQFGPRGSRPALAVIDLHSTTSSMGNCLVVYGRRPTDLALAAAIQAQLGLPIYLHEGDAAQRGFLVESWPCGLVIEVGPVPQGVIEPRLCLQSQLALEAALAALAAAERGCLAQPPGLVVHRHLASLDLPRDGGGWPLACLHPLRQGRDWQPMEPGDPLFRTAAGESIAYEPPAGLEDQRVWPLFINEAAYGEKRIALSITSRERWTVDPSWAEALTALLTKQNK